MATVDRAGGAVSLRAAVGAFGRQLAVCVGALVALASLVADNPVSAASLRGAVATLALVGLTRVAEWFSARTAAPPRVDAEDGGAAGAPEASR